MSFLLPLALLLGLAAIAPILAHALRKGQARPLPFPAAHLVPSRSSSAKERNRVEDRFLLLLRVLLLCCLALLAASPLAQCSRLSLGRSNGASVFATLVIDDSASMRARQRDGESRLTAALADAQNLLSTSQPGDAFAIVLSGQPARVLSPPTTNLESIEQALSSIQPSDRRTDLASALSLARSLGSDLPHKDRPLFLLSDLAIDSDTPLNLKGVVIPSEQLREAFSNCAVIEASPAGHSVLVEIACTDDRAIRGRKLELLDDKDSAIAPPMDAHDGALQIELPEESQEGATLLRLQNAKVRLTKPAEPNLDQIPEDDSTPLLNVAARLVVGLRADESKAGIKTGAGTVLSVAIEALDRDVRVQELSLMPDNVDELDSLNAIIIDDPSGFTPESRDALGLWVQEGGVAVLFVGPGVERTPLGNEFSPFVVGPPRWISNKSPGVSPKVPGSLGPLSTSWSDLNAPHRVLLPQDDSLQVRTRWEDGEALIVERPSGRGTFITIGLPSSVDESDLALRPAFLELLDYVITQSEFRTGARATPVGTRWPLPEGTRAEGIDGDLLNILSDSRTSGDVPAGQPPMSHFVEPTLAGRYRIVSSVESKKAYFRFATRDLDEHVRQPNPNFRGEEGTKGRATRTKVDISRQIALLTLVLGVLELAFRGFRRRGRSGPLVTAHLTPS